MRILALVPPFASAFWSLTEPWARARVILVWGLTRSPEASLLVAGGLAATLAAGIAVAWTGRRQRLAGCVHLATGAMLAFVSWRAYVMVTEAGVSALFLPIASVQPGRGLLLFAAAAAWLVVLGLLELAFDARSRVRRRRAVQAMTAAPEPTAVAPSAEAEPSPAARTSQPSAAPQHG
jgi:hypothetical protein